MADELLTANKVAAQLGVKPKQVKDAIATKDIEPDQTKGACKYYGPKTVAKIKKAIE